MRTLRRGMTLIELLVVLTIMVVLFAIVAAVGPHFSERQRASRGASQLYGWFLIAKQRAVRDGAPRGIRLISPSGPFYAQYVTQLQYIEQPDPYTPATLDASGTTTVTADISFNGAFKSVAITWSPSTVADINGAITQAMNALQPDTTIPPDVVLDYYGRYPGQPRRVISIQPISNGLALTLDNVMEPGTFPSLAPPSSKAYRLYRQSQPIPGEPVLQMPRDVAIDISRDPNATTAANQTWYRTFPRINAGGGRPFDILFDQTGQVIGAGGRSGNRICLWVRDISINTTGPNVSNDPTATDPTVLPPGDNTLITIYTRTGLLASHPVNPNGLVPNSAANPNSWNPFSFTQDGLSSGI